jgi:hypothetical protein
MYNIAVFFVSNAIFFALMVLKYSISFLKATAIFEWIAALIIAMVAMHLTKTKYVLGKVLMFFCSHSI